MSFIQIFSSLLKLRTQSSLVLIVVFVFVFAFCKEKKSETQSHEPKLLLVNLPIEGENGVFFLETFNNETSFKNRWKNLEGKKYKGKLKLKDVEEKILGGSGNKQGDKGLYVSSENEFHGIMVLFPSPLIKKDQDLVIQYEIKLTEKIDCSGGYIKLLTNSSSPHTPKTVDHTTPFSVMFGPDKCGQSTDKVHFIYQHRNLSTNKDEEIKMITKENSQESRAMRLKADNQTHLYTLRLRGKEFSISIDQEEIKKGSLYDSQQFEPPLLQPEFIPDLKDKKPRDWVDEEFILGVDEERPDDWNEDEPETRVDPTAKLPAGWVERPFFIPDPSKKKPRDWSDEEDGVWTPPLVENPACKDGKTQCGPWKAPTVKNPEYRGKWKRPLVRNPKYKGPWSPRLISNPSYRYDPHPHHFAPMVGLVLEIWALQKGMLFDNFIITTNPREAERFAEKTWKVKHTEEYNRLYPPLSLNERYNIVIDYLRENPVIPITICLSVLLCVFFFWLIRFVNNEASEDEDQEQAATNEPSQDERTENSKTESEMPTTSQAQVVVPNHTTELQLEQTEKSNQTKNENKSKKSTRESSTQPKVQTAQPKTASSQPKGSPQAKVAPKSKKESKKNQ